MIRVLLLIALAVVFGRMIALWRARRAAAAGVVSIAPNDPAWVAAVERARTTSSVMRGLHVAGHDVWVKYPFRTDADEREHVWGRLLAIAESALRVSLETRPLTQRGPHPTEVTIPVADLEDWQAELPDGSIRGGFTTRAEIEIARREHLPVPPHVAELSARMVDV